MGGSAPCTCRRGSSRAGGRHPGAVPSRSRASCAAPCAPTRAGHSWSPMSRSWSRGFSPRWLAMSISPPPPAGATSTRASWNPGLSRPGRRPRSRCSARCTGRRRATADDWYRDCAGRIRARWLSSMRQRARGRTAAWCRRGSDAPHPRRPRRGRRPSRVRRMQTRQKGTSRAHVAGPATAGGSHATSSSRAPPRSGRSSGWGICARGSPLSRVPTTGRAQDDQAHPSPIRPTWCSSSTTN